MCELKKVINESKFLPFKLTNDQICDIDILKSILFSYNIEPITNKHQVKKHSFYIIMQDHHWKVSSCFIKNAWQIVPQTIHINYLIDLLQHLEKGTYDIVYNVEFENKYIWLYIAVKKNQIQIKTIQENCYSLTVFMVHKTSHLNFILFKQNKCEGYKQFYHGGFGTWLLQLTDYININLGIHTCELLDDSYFLINNTYANAPYLYAKTHWGLTYYMSHGYLIKGKNVQDSILLTNQEIKYKHEWWSQTLNNFKKYKFHDNIKIIRDIDDYSTLHSILPKKEVIDMIKYYNVPSLTLYKPIKNGSAFFHNGPLVIKDYKPLSFMDDLVKQYKSLWFHPKYDIVLNEYKDDTKNFIFIRYQDVKYIMKICNKEDNHVIVEFKSCTNTKCYDLNTLIQDIIQNNKTMNQRTMKLLKSVQDNNVNVLSPKEWKEYYQQINQCQKIYEQKNIIKSIFNIPMQQEHNHLYDLIYNRDKWIQEYKENPFILNDILSKLKYIIIITKKDHLFVTLEFQHFILDNQIYKDHFYYMSQHHYSTLTIDYKLLFPIKEIQEIKSTSNDILNWSYDQKDNTLSMHVPII